VTFEFVDSFEHGGIRDGKDLSRNAYPCFLHPAYEGDTRVIHFERILARVRPAEALRSIEQAVVAVACHERAVRK
jgi:hypothetical protein